MRMLLFAIFICVMPNMAFGVSLASKEYVTEYVANKSEMMVSTSQTANQTMAGSYTVSGTLIVPTPPLPSI